MIIQDLDEIPPGVLCTVFGPSPMSGIFTMEGMQQRVIRVIFGIRTVASEEVAPIGLNSW